jgi:hypothetical protein
MSFEVLVNIAPFPRFTIISLVEVPSHSYEFYNLGVEGRQCSIG